MRGVPSLERHEARSAVRRVLAEPRARVRPTYVAWTLAAGLVCVAPWIALAYFAVRAWL